MMPLTEADAGWYSLGISTAMMQMEESGTHRTCYQGPGRVGQLILEGCFSSDTGRCYLFTYSLAHSFNKHLLSTYYGLSTVRDTGGGEHRPKSLLSWNLFFKEQSVTK